MKLFLSFLLLIIPLASYSQDLDSKELFNKIVLLKDVSNGRNHHGTGFILNFEEKYYLVTARHVADSLQKQSTLIYFRDSTQNIAIEFNLKKFIKKDSLLAFNEKSDFFIMQLNPFDSISLEYLKRSSLGIHFLFNHRTSIDRKYELIVMGYPIYDFDHFSPITFKSYFSSGLMNIKVISFNDPCYCYLLENPSMSGFSGGPVFIGVKDRSSNEFKHTFIVGIVTATTYDKTGGKFSVITPTFHLLDLIVK